MTRITRKINERKYLATLQWFQMSFYDNKENQIKAMIIDRIE